MLTTQRKKTEEKTDKFSFIYVHRNPDYDFRPILQVLQNEGGECIAFLQRIGIDLNYPLSEKLTRVPFERGNYQTPISTILHERNTAQNPVNPVIIFFDEPEVSAEELKDHIRKGTYDPEAIIFFEKVDRSGTEKLPWLARLDRRIRGKLQGPSASIWLIPAAAAALADGSLLQKKMFLFGWLLKCRKNHIRTHLIREDITTGKTWESNALSTVNLFFYSLNVLLRYSFSSILSFLVDNLIFYLLIRLGQSNLTALIGGRAISLLVNFSLLKTVVFKTKEKGHAAFLKYIALVIFSGSVVWLVITTTEKYLGFHPMPVKLTIEFVMFFFNYFVSRSYIFR